VNAAFGEDVDPAVGRMGDGGIVIIIIGVAGGWGLVVGRCESWRWWEDGRW
jgi:hypothetical protein